MRRRDFLAGAASLGVLGAAGAVAVTGNPFSPSGEEPRHDPVTVDTIEATGSDAGQLTIPDDGRATFVDLFATTCNICEAQMPELRTAYEAADEDVTFVSVTNESESFVDDEGVADWWDEYDGTWTVARDETSELVVHYGAGTPIAVLFDADGRLRWEESGGKTSEEILEQIERVI